VFEKEAVPSADWNALPCKAIHVYFSHPHPRVMANSAQASEYYATLGLFNFVLNRTDQKLHQRPNIFSNYIFYFAFCETVSSLHKITDTVSSI
jgi:hypothetical protein